MPFNTALLWVLWIVAIFLGIWEYARSKGEIGRSLMVTLGGGLIATFVVTPDILKTTVPMLFKKVIDWAASII